LEPPERMSGSLKGVHVAKRFVFQDVPSLGSTC
jgi:hypothetical protein